jgi:RNA polymerase-binding protein DksA
MTCHVARRTNEFERRLGRERREAYRALVTTNAELAGLEAHSAGEFSDDAATEATCRVLESLRDRDRRVLREVGAAEGRLSMGSFGVCAGCARPIPYGRLRALPAARLCIGCEEAEESGSNTR